MKKYKIASILMITHGGLLELGGGLALIPIMVSGYDKNNFGEYFTFIVPYLNQNLSLMLVMGAIFGIVRITGAIGLLKNRMWGLALSIINCVITMALMIFMLPAGVIDGILACSALIIILMQYYGDMKIIQ